MRESFRARSLSGKCGSQLLGLFRSHGRLGTYRLSFFIATSILDANANHAQSHHPRRDIAEKRNSRENADKPRDVQCFLFLRSKRRRDHPLLELRLKGVNDPYGPFTLTLNSAKLVGRNAAIEQRLCKQVARHDGVLNRVIDSQAADGGHRVRRVADQQQAGLYHPWHRLDSTESSDTWCQSVSDSTFFARRGSISRIRRRNPSIPSVRSDWDEPFAMTNATCQ